MSEINNKNKEKSILTSICVLGIGLVAGLFLTLENRTTQTNLIESVKQEQKVLIYEGAMAECGNKDDKCIRIDSGSSIEKFK